jgi:hypothetical protein
MFKPGVVEIAADGLLVGYSHGLCVVGFREISRLITMAGHANLFVCETLMNRYPGIWNGCRDTFSRQAPSGRPEQRENQEDYSLDRCRPYSCCHPIAPYGHGTTSRRHGGVTGKTGC